MANGYWLAFANGKLESNPFVFYILRFNSKGLNILRVNSPQNIENKDSQNRGWGTSAMSQFLSLSRFPD